MSQEQQPQQEARQQPVPPAAAPEAAADSATNGNATSASASSSTSTSNMHRLHRRMSERRRIILARQQHHHHQQQHYQRLQELHHYHQHGLLTHNHLPPLPPPPPRYDNPNNENDNDNDNNDISAFPMRLNAGDERLAEVMMFMSHDDDVVDVDVDVHARVDNDDGIVVDNNFHPQLHRDFFDIDADIDSEDFFYDLHRQRMLDRLNARVVNDRERERNRHRRGQGDNDLNDDDDSSSSSSSFSNEEEALSLYYRRRRHLRHHLRRRHHHHRLHQHLHDQHHHLDPDDFLDHLLLLDEVPAPIPPHRAWGLGSAASVAPVDPLRRQHHRHLSRHRSGRPARNSSSSAGGRGRRDHHNNNSSNSSSTGLCVVCNSFSRYTVCVTCYESHSQSNTVWKAWIKREQAEYQKHLGCTHWNLHWDPIYVQRRCVVNPELLLLKRIRACIGWAVHGLLFEFLDGTRAGYVVDVTSINDDEAIERRRCTDWVNVTSGDYITKVRGYNLSRSCFLCHTIHFEFASGKVVSFESSHEPWKGNTFLYNLPDNALVHHISFREGKCIGVSAAETVMHLPVESPKRVHLQLHKVHQDTFRFLQLVAQRIDKVRMGNGAKVLGTDLWRTIICDYLACYDLQDYNTSAIGKLLLVSSSSSKSKSKQSQKQAEESKQKKNNIIKK